VNIVIRSVDHAPDDLYDQIPIRARLVRRLEGADSRGRSYWLAELRTPIAWSNDGVPRTVNHVLLAARWQGTSLEPGAKVPVNIAYVTNDAVLSSAGLDLSHAAYVAIDMAKVSRPLRHWPQFGLDLFRAALRIGQRIVRSARD
jgi:hypothetical protein